MFRYKIAIRSSETPMKQNRPNKVFIGTFAKKFTYCLTVNIQLLLIPLEKNVLLFCGS